MHAGCSKRCEREGARSRRERDEVVFWREAKDSTTEMLTRGSGLAGALDSTAQNGGKRSLLT